MTAILMKALRTTRIFVAAAAIGASPMIALAAAPADGTGAAKAANPPPRASKTLLARGNDRSTPEQKVAACWTEWYCNVYGQCWWATRCW